MAGLLFSSTSSRRQAAEPGTPRPATLSGLLAALHAAGLGLLTITVLVLVGWVTASHSGASAGEAVAAALQVWLVGQHTALAVPGGGFGLLPLGLTLLPGGLLFAAAGRAARVSGLHAPRGVAALTAVLSAAYAVIAALVALLAGTDAVRPLPVSAFLGAGGLALVAGGAGALRAAGCGAVLWHRLPAALRLAAAGAVGALTTLLAGGAGLAAVSLFVHQDRATALMRGLHAGASGGLLVFLLCLLYAPTAVVWAAAFAVGPGFAVGAGTQVTFAGVDLGAVPAVPLLAALPGDGAPGPTALMALLVPVVAGVVAGRLVDRRDAALPESELGTWRRLAGLAAAAGGLAGLAVAALCALTSGPGGPGRLAEVGPSPWWVGLAAAGEVGLVAAATLLLRHRGLLSRPGDADLSG